MCKTAQRHQCVNIDLNMYLHKTGEKGEFIKKTLVEKMNMILQKKTGVVKLKPQNMIK